MKKATRKYPALTGVILMMGLVLAIVTVPYAIGADPPADVPTFSVMDTSGAAVQYATVYAIPTADVDALANEPLTLQSTGNYTAAALAVDEPLEDLINGNYTPAGGGVSTYHSGVTDGEGKAEIADLPTGESDMFFIYVKPASGDAEHLPGGSLTRTAVSGASLDNMVTHIVVSTKPSAAATFVGSSSCLGCHSDKTAVEKTAHKNGFMVPGEPSGLQDLSQFNADDGVYNASAALENKFTESGTTVYFYDYDSTRKFDKFKTSETDPGAGHTVSATVKVFKDAADGKYKMTFTNVQNPSDPNSPFTELVDLTYGGGVYKQRYLTAQGASIHMLPLQYNSRGDEASTDRVRKVWRDYHMDWWINSPGATQTFKAQPANNNAVDVQCASCHFNGYSVSGNSTIGFSASGVADPNGEKHPVTGDHQELNIGCETCHGPGSEHVAAGGQGESIVTPQNLTPERETTICSQCHSRPQGNDSLGIKKDGPLNSANKTMVAGTSRADFLANYTSRHDASATAGDFWSDGLHSKSHHQQYTDFIQSAMYRNGSQLETCSSCHDNHAPGTDRHQLSGTSDDSLCLSCHSSVNSSDHQIAKSGYDMGATCIECHNVKISTSGAGTNVTGTYPHGDVSSHLFDVPDKTKVGSAKMPVPYTNTCGSCHWPLSNPPAGERPELKLQKQAVYWASYADYTASALSVDYNVVNDSTSIAGNAYGVQMVGTANSAGVTSINTPLPVGHIPAGYGAATTSKVKYNVPVGVGFFWSTVNATAEDGAHTSYDYPTP
jgi:hypothetical protein